MRRIKRITILFLSLVLTSSMMVFASPKPLYDVIVIGSDPEGISAAVSAAREGARVLLIDKRNQLGGLYTSGMLSMLDMNYKKSNSLEVVNGGFFSEFYDRVAYDTSFDIEHTKQYFKNLLNNNNVTTVLSVSAYEPIIEGNAVKGVTYTKGGQHHMASSATVIDATHDAQFARMAGAPYVVGREDLGVKGEYAAATLVFSVSGVDWLQVTRYLNGDNSIYTGANGGVAWGYEQMLNFTPSSPRIQLRRLNMSRQKNDSVVINALQIFGVDSLDETSKSEAYYLAISQLEDIVQFLRSNAPGFENAKLDRIADELYIREGVRIVGEDALTSEDVFTNKNHHNKIAYGSYPTDLQATKRDFSGGTILTGRNLYTVPFGIMLPKDVPNLFVVGRSAGYDSIAHSSARTVPVGVALGQAAGVASAYSINNNVSLKEINDSALHMTHLQNRLTELGVDLTTALPTDHPEKSNWAYSYIQHLRSQGLLSMEHNYVNHYYCDNAANNETVRRIITLIKQNSNLPLGDVVFSPLYTDQLNQTGVLNIVNQMLGTSYATIHDLIASDILDDTVGLYITGSSQLTNAHIYALMDNVVSHIRVTHDMPVPALEEITRYDKLEAEPQPDLEVLSDSDTADNSITK